MLNQKKLKKKKQEQGLFILTELFKRNQTPASLNFLGYLQQDFVLVWIFTPSQS
jgi:hypothetical protein